jgi:hypothetical protein
MSRLPKPDLANNRTHVTLRDNPDRNVTALHGHTVTRNWAVASTDKQ